MTWNNYRINIRLGNIQHNQLEEIYSLIANIDAIKKSWYISKRLSPRIIEKLTQSVIVTSTGASNRIEGNRMSDQEVETLYKNLKIQKLKSRDEQEVAGYIKVLEYIFYDYNNIPVSESFIKQIHSIMLNYSEKDQSHKGNYKISSNRVEAKDNSGNIVGIVFEPTQPYLVNKEMQELIDWYSWSLENSNKHPLILIANFIFEFLAIHPFQDGNGRASRLLTNLMLLRQDYNFTTLVSHEKIIENYKVDYYLALNKVQQSWKSSNEDITPWLIFFLKIVKEQADQAIKLLETENIDYLLSEKQLAIWNYLLDNNIKEFSRKDIIKNLGFAERTIESSIKKLVELKRLQRLGEGKASRYLVINKII